MCFTIPLQVLKVKNDFVTVEGGKVVRIDKNLHVKKGTYLQVAGNLAVGMLPKKEGLRIRQLIKRLN